MNMNFIKNKLSPNQKRIISFFRYSFFRINWFKTIYFNLKALPFREALKIPIVVGRNVRLRNIGKIILGCKAEPALVSIGVIYIDGWEAANEGVLIFNNKGTIVFNGLAKFYPACKIFVNGNLTMGGRNNIGSRTCIICYNNISIGNNTGCSWDCSFSDTNFHPLKDLIGNRYLKQNGKIVVGDNVFIGNHTSISMNTNIPNGCVVSAYSKVSGSFKREGENLLIGTPIATVLDKGYQMEDFNQFKPLY